ncbi:sulfite exporter TauE/SafE family protein [Candidatus Uhrbacteria bacterium]|nr:sulfite exporter TauE/SafE family protein [Candidatus Uhrbacteria bacterium]
MILIPFALIAVGLMTGILSGVVGIGGGVIIVPILIFFFGFSQHTAQGTSVAMLLPPIGFLAAWTYWQQGFIDVRTAALLAVGFFIGGLIGARLATVMSPFWLQRVFGVIMLAISIHMIVGKR